MFDLNYSDLEKLGKKTYRLKDIEHKIVRVAFDIVRLQGEPIDELWEIQSADDGDYIVARYNTEDETAPIKQASARSPWEAVAKEGEVHLFYKGASFTKFAHVDAEYVVNFLPTKLSNDQHFVEALFSALSPERQTEVKKLYPELF